MKTKLLQMQIKDRACTICDNLYRSGRAKSKRRCDECGEQKRNWALALGKLKVSNG